jgi:hypothetical protein
MFAAAAQAEIRQTASMQEAMSIVQADDVVVFDIDNTIVETVQTLGSDQWVDYLIAKYQKRGMDVPHAVEAALADWVPVQKVTGMRTVEDITPAIIRRLQNSGVKVLALTARPPELVPSTIKNLSANGVQFVQYDGYTSDGVVTYAGGILFANGKNKGTVLRDFLRQLKLEPKRLIFIDDKEKNVKNMDDEFSKGPFPDICFRYGAADARVKAFSADIAELEWDYFIRQNILISDEAAAEILHGGGLAAAQ